MIRRFWIPLLIGLLAQSILAMPNDTLSVQTILMDGIEAGRKKDFNTAKQKFEQALNYWQTSASAHLYLQILKDASEKKFKNKYATEIFKALNEQNLARHKKALKRISKVIKKNKEYFPAYIVQGGIYTSQENYAKAEEAYTQAINLAPNSVLPWLFRGKYYGKTEQFKKAVDDYTQALQLATWPIEFFERGFVYCLLKEYDEAITDFEKAFLKYPQWQNSTVVYEAYHNRGVQRLNGNAYHGAVSDFSHAIQINPDYLSSYLNRGIAFKHLKKYQKAIKDFNFCLARKPDFREAYYNRGLTYFEQRAYSKAADDFRKALEYAPDDVSVQFKLAECYYNSRKYKRAVVHFNRVLKLNPSYFWAYYWKGYALEGLKRRQQAISAFQKFISLAPKQYYKQIAHAKVEIRKLGGSVR
ncbi:MAG: tetratricopeptide repeat protein [Calditrichaeota bacterium]|nr:MAG: tetratricopeptide repeat protein [Calditrichota bacterium]